MNLFNINRRWLGLGLGLMMLGATIPAQSQEKLPTVQLSTTLGEIVIELFPEKAPKTVGNFIQYVKDQHYKGVIFHRVIDGFMIQTGGYTTELAQKPTRQPIPLEANNGLKNDRGTVAMARAGYPHSATSQFFINVVDNPGLNAPQPDGYGYAVFGRVISGMDVVDSIRSVPTTRKGPHQNLPSTPVIILSTTFNP